MASSTLSHSALQWVLELAGDFIKKDNRKEFNDAFNKMVQTSIELQLLIRRIAESGEYGSIFAKLKDEKLHTTQTHSKIESIMHAIEDEVRSMIKTVCECCRIFESCFLGIYKEKTDSRYDGLTNFRMIAGNNNTDFVERLSEARKALSECLALVTELEVLDC